MESPVTIIKSNLTVGKLLAGAVVFLAIAALFDLAGITDALLRPVSFVKSKMNRA